MLLFLSFACICLHSTILHPVIFSQRSIVAIFSSNERRVRHVFCLPLVSLYVILLRNPGHTRRSWYETSTRQQLIATHPAFQVNASNYIFFSKTHLVYTPFPFSTCQTWLKVIHFTRKVKILPVIGVCRIYLTHPDLNQLSHCRDVTDC